jgi:MFS family permease
MDMTTIDRNVRSNIWKLYVARALSGCLFGIPVIVLLFQRTGLSLREVYLVQAAFALTVVLLEIPSGYLSDRWGRKPTLVSSFILCALGYAAYANAHDFFGFVVADVCIGIGVSFFSGTYEAMTYDTLLELGEEKENRRIAGRQFSLDLAAEGVATLIGGAIALWSIPATMWLSAAAFVLAALVASRLVEPRRHAAKERRHWSAMWDVCTHTLIRHRGLRSITLLVGIIGTMSLTLFWFTQPYQTVAGLPLYLWGAMHGVTVLLGAAAAWRADWVKARLDDRYVIMGIAATTVGVYLALSAFQPHVALLALFPLSRIGWTLLNPFSTDMVNRMTESHVRATVLSVSSFGQRLLFIVTSPLVGLLADEHGIPFALYVAGLTGGAILLVVFIRLRTVWDELPR